MIISNLEKLPEEDIREPMQEVEAPLLGDLREDRVLYQEGYQKEVSEPTNSTR